MRLEIDIKKKTENPDDQAITDGLAAMKWEAVLRRDEVTYIRTSREADEGFPLEYQEDSTENHFKAVGNFSLARVSQAFLAFSRGDASWKAGFEWVKVTGEDDGGSGAGSGENLGCGVGLVLAGLLILGGNLGWIPKTDWFVPAVLVGWGSSMLYKFYRHRTGS
jgi:hypothetical protein